MTSLIDSHCHIDFPQFDTDREAVLAHCLAQGMAALIVPGVALSQWPGLHQTVMDYDDTDVYPRLFPAYGLHPCFMREHEPQHVYELDTWLQQHAVAVGEIGLDAFHGSSDLEQQRRLFRDQLSVARNHDLPIIVHARKTQDLVLKLVKESRLQKGGIMHAFSGSLQQAQKAVELGFKIGFGGASTYDRARKLKTLLQALPHEAIVFETDSPDIPPCFAAKARNSPANLVRIIEILADVRQEPAAELWSYSTNNLIELFKLSL